MIMLIFNFDDYVIVGYNGDATSSGSPVADPVHPGTQGTLAIEPELVDLEQGLAFLSLEQKRLRSNTIEIT